MLIFSPSFVNSNAFSLDERGLDASKSRLAIFNTGNRYEESQKSMSKKNDNSEQELQQREKTELIAIIKLMLQQQPDLAWVLQTPLPTTGKSAMPINTALYSSQIETAVAASIKHDRDRSYRETLKNTLAAIQSMADTFASKEDYAAALTIYEILTTAAIRSFFAVETGYLIFPTVLLHCIDGLDTCFAGAEEDRQMRQRVLKALFAIYSFSLASSMDLGEDIPDLLIGNPTPEERQVIAGWVRDALVQLPDKAGVADEQSRKYRTLLHQLEKEGLE